MENIVQPKILSEIRTIPMVFIVGLGRSGTTLLQELMNSHPNIVAPPEYSFIVYLYSRFGNKKHWTKADIMEFVEALYFRPLFSVWLIDRKELTEKLLAITEYADYPLICKMIFYQMSKGKEKVLLFCDKNPENSLLIKTLLKVFPDAKFIHMIRDPRDNVNSQIRSFGKKNIFFNAWRWKGYNSSIENIKKKMPSRFYTVLYENLVRNTEPILQSLCKFLNVPFVSSIMENNFPERLNAIKEDKVFKRVKTMHQGLLNPINSSNIGKWEKELSPENVAITEAITGTLAHQKYGYIIKEKREMTERIANVKLLRAWLLYHTWKLYTRLRYKSYRLNKMHYTKKMKSRPLGA